MTCGQSHMGGTKYSQAMVDQRPRFDKSVYSKKLKVRRPDKRKNKQRFL